MLGTTFGGHHLACSAVLSVLNTLNEENLLKNSKNLGEYFKNKLSNIQLKTFVKFGAPEEIVYISKICHPFIIK